MQQQGLRRIALDDVYYGVGSSTGNGGSSAFDAALGLILCLCISDVILCTVEL